MKCPNCGVEIKRFDISENCKNCGINLFYSQQETLLSRDAKRCELEFASFRIFVSKLKAAFIGSKLAILRLAFSVLCVAAILVPFAGISLELPLFSSKLSFGGIGVYNAFSDGTLMALLDFYKLPLSHDIALKSFVLLGIILLVAVCSLVLLVYEILSFINITKTAKAMRNISLTGAVFSIASIVSAILVANGSPVAELSCGFGFGGIVCMAFFLVMFGINYLILKKDIQPEIRELDIKRVELYRKVKAKEISLDDLPLPVFYEPPKEPKKKEKRKFGRRKKK